MKQPGRVGLGTLRLPGEAWTATVHAALDSGILLFDTARAYPGGERRLAEALASHPAGARAAVVTKGGMDRPGGNWRPDGRASRLRSDCDASLQALGRPIDLYLVHAPDPRVKWATTVRALRRLSDEKLVQAVGVCNVNLAQLDEALALAPITAVQVGFSLLDDLPLRSGVLARCRERGIALIAHSPLGGPKRAGKLLGAPVLLEIARRHGVAPAAVALAALLDAHPHVTVIPGARSPQAVRELAVTLVLDDGERAALAGEFPALRDRPVVAAAPGDGEVVLIMGLPGAGKSAAAQSFAGYERLNRDQLGGSLAALAARLDERLAAGARRLVLDNTWLTRAARAQVLSIAARHGVAVRGVFIDVPVAEAQVNVVERMLAAHDRLLTPEELRDKGALSPSSFWRMARSIEPLGADEGFTSLEVRPFTRMPKREPGRPARFVALELLDELDGPRSSFAFGWAPDAAPDLEARIGPRVQGVAICRHPGGPPRCWCRPPLPGLVMSLARAHLLDVRASELHGTSRAHRALAAAVGARFIDRG